MIAVIRICGKVKTKREAREALERLKLNKKYSCVLLNPTKENLGVLKFLENLVAYGETKKETLTKLIEKRGKPLEKGKKIDVKKVLEGIEKKKPEELGIKRVFRLHPPIGGINTKIHYPKGVLGNNKEGINKLIGKML